MREGLANVTHQFSKYKNRKEYKVSMSLLTWVIEATLRYSDVWNTRDTICNIYKEQTPPYTPFTQKHYK